MDHQNLFIDHKERILYITINRESKLNALNSRTSKREKARFKTV